MWFISEIFGWRLKETKKQRLSRSIAFIRTVSKTDYILHLKIKTCFNMIMYFAFSHSYDIFVLTDPKRIDHIRSAQFDTQHFEIHYRINQWICSVLRTSNSTQVHYTSFIFISFLLWFSMKYRDCSAKSNSIFSLCFKHDFRLFTGWGYFFIEIEFLMTSG